MRSNRRAIRIRRQAEDLGPSRHLSLPRDAPARKAWSISLRPERSARAQRVSPLVEDSPPVQSPAQAATRRAVGRISPTARADSLLPGHPACCVPSSFRAPVNPLPRSDPEQSERWRCRLTQPSARLRRARPQESSRHHSARRVPVLPEHSGKPRQSSLTLALGRAAMISLPLSWSSPRRESVRPADWRGWPARESLMQVDLPGHLRWETEAPFAANSEPQVRTACGLKSAPVRQERRTPRRSATRPSCLLRGRRFPRDRSLGASAPTVGVPQEVGVE